VLSGRDSKKLPWEERLIGGFTMMKQGWDCVLLFASFGRSLVGNSEFSLEMGDWIT
jgi:hypothetical protein